MKQSAPNFAHLASLSLSLAGALACASEPGTTKGSPSGAGGGVAASTSSGGRDPDNGGVGGWTDSGENESAGGQPSEMSGGAGGSEQEPTAQMKPDAVGSGGDSSFDDLSSFALDGLRKWLNSDAATRSPIETEDFSASALSKADAETARALIWEDHAEQIRASRQSEVEDKTTSIAGTTLNYEMVFLGAEPEGGRSLFISMHGGGNAPKETNDEQWQNQILLAESYAPEDALWIAPRAPIDDWNMWFTDQIPPLFDRLITNMIVFEGINPNKVYITGYSAGGDGVYQLGPTMADRWAAAAMSAGHPNDMTPLNLRNIGFAIHVGGNDDSYDRNLVAAEWGEWLMQLQLSDLEGYAHQVEVHEGLPHWMDLADQPSIPFVQGFVRNPAPQKVVWKQSTLLETRFYWLEIEPEAALKDVEVVASLDGQTITIESEDLNSLTLRLSDEMLDLDQEVSVEFNGAAVFEGMIHRTIAALHAALITREDPKMMYSAQLVVKRD